MLQNRRSDGSYKIPTDVSECAISLLRKKPTATNETIKVRLGKSGFSPNYCDMAGANARRILGINSKEREIDRTQFLAYGGDPDAVVPSSWRWVNKPSGQTIADRFAAEHYVVPIIEPEPEFFPRPSPTMIAPEDQCFCGIPKSIPHDHCTIDNAVEKIKEIDGSERLTPAQARRARDEKRPLIMRMLEMMAIATRKTDGFVSASIEITSEKAVLTVTRRVTQSETVEV